MTERSNRVILIAVFVLLSGFGTVAAEQDWPTHHANLARSGSVDGSNMGTVHPPWVLEKRGLGYSSPALANDTLYLGAYESLVALDASSGEVKWTFPTEGRLVVESSPAVAGDMVFFSHGGYLYAIDADAGTEAWRSGPNVSGIWSPVVADGLVYTTNGTNLITLTAKNGSTYWEQDLGGTIFFSMTVRGGVAYVGAGQVFYAIDTESGDILGSYNETSGNIMAASAVTETAVIFTTNGGAVVALDPAFVSKPSRDDDAVLWRIQTGGPVTSAVAVSNGTVYVGSHDGHIYAVAEQTGEILWKQFLNAYFRSAPAWGNGAVYVGADDLLALRENGTVGQEPTTGAIFALDSDTGEVLWEHETDQPIYVTPATAGGMVYGTSLGEDVFAISDGARPNQLEETPTVGLLGIVGVLMLVSMRSRLSWKVK